MKTEGFHFTGKFRGLFKASPSGVTHAASFFELKVTHIEISNISPVKNRDWQKERVGDYLYFPSLRPKSKWFGGVDLVLIKDDTTAFSEKIEHVILSHYSFERNYFSPVRTFRGFKTKDFEQWLEGDIFFSLPAPKLKPVPPATPQLIKENPVSAPADTTYTIPNLVSGTKIASPNIASGTPQEQNPGCLGFFRPTQKTIAAQEQADLNANRGCFSLLSKRNKQVLPSALPSSASTFLSGCFSRLFKLIGWILVLYLIFRVLTFLSGLLSDRVANDNILKEDGAVEIEDPRLDPNQDTLASFPWNYLVDHKVEWNDFINQQFKAVYSTKTLDYDASKKRRQSWSQVPVENEIAFFQDLYADLFRGDEKKMDSIVNYFKVERRNKNMNPFQTAEMVVTFIQEIPYVLVHDGACSEASAGNEFASDYHSKGLPCLPNIFAGVQSPYEFLHNLKGDCDTRSLLAFAILDKLDVGASVWISREYGHSILGVAVPANSPHYKQVSGTRFYATELTAKGFRVGMIAPEQTNMNNWKIVLTNK